MKVTLIAPYSDIFCMGVRSLAACLKEDGQQVQVIFLPRPALEHRDISDWRYRYNEKTMNDVVEICEGSGFIGISLMTNYFPRVAQLTEHLKKKFSIPIAWGGIHATIRPEECLEYADMVCIGEGEEAIVELVRKMDAGENYLDTQNFWFRKDGEIISNPPRPLIQDLDKIPFPDYELSNHFILNDGKLRQMNFSLLEKYLARTPNSLPDGVVYPTMATRGCPHMCAYCCNNVLRRLYSNQKYLRRRSAENVIAELLDVKSKMSFVKAIDFEDDCLLAAKEEEIEEFAKLYKEKVGLPFRCYTSPMTLNKKKMDCLVDAGLRHIVMGIQTGSEETKLLYRRKIPNNRVIESAELLNMYVPRILPPSYDLIIDNPYETNDDLIATLQLLLKLPRPHTLRIFSLVLFPGTELYTMAKKDNLIQDEMEQVYHKHYHKYQATYLNTVFSLFRAHFPKKILRILINKKVVWLFNRKWLNGFYGVVYELSRRRRTLTRKIRAALFGRVQHSPTDCSNQ